MRLSGKIKRLCIFLALAALPFGVAGQTATSPNEFNTAAVQAPHLSVQLVTARDVIHPGDSLQAGLYFKLDKGWHVYWSNAGDSGEPPRIRWTLPEGITASRLLILLSNEKGRRRRAAIIPMTRPPRTAMP